METKFPKKAPHSLIKRVDKAISSIKAGTARFRKTERYGYRTLALGQFERLVMVGEVAHIFNKHSDYEKFINIAR